MVPATPREIGGTSLGLWLWLLHCVLDGRPVRAPRARAGLPARPAPGSGFPIGKRVGEKGSAVAVSRLIFLSGLKILEQC